MLQFFQSMPEERAFSLCDGHYDAKCSNGIILNNLTSEKWGDAYKDFLTNISIITL